MNLGASSDVLRFRHAIERQLGLDFGDEKLDLLQSVFAARLRQTGTLPQAYLAGLESQPSRQECRALGELLTISETYFFRHRDQLDAFIDVAVPACIEQHPASRLSILSAGCASGEEAYSLAMLLHERGLQQAASIHGVDLNPAAIERARRALFTSWSLRATPEAARRRWFHPKGRDFTLDAAITAMAGFEQRNLADADEAFWAEARFDIIFCRNMLMYFSPASARATIARMAHALVPGGYLFLGHAETLRGLSDDFHLCHTHDCFYYRRRAPHETVEPVVSTLLPTTAPIASAREKDIAEPARDVEKGTGWFDAIRCSSERIEELRQRQESGRPADAAQIVAPNLREARELVQQERFVDALNTLTTLPAEAADDADALLLKAVLQVHTGQTDAAEMLCRRLLDGNELDAGAHYVLALCREAIGDAAGSVDHLQRAAYLNPNFAMPHVHLGLLARRAGERETARRELNQALLLLQCEDVSRLLLFGGGFSREALLALCRAELAACGERHAAF